MVRLPVLASLLLSLVVPSSATSAPLAKEAEVNGVRLSYIEQGSGEPIVFVHGAFSDLRVWEPGRRSPRERRSPTSIGSSPTHRDITGSAPGRMTGKSTASRPTWTISPSSSRRSMRVLFTLSAGPVAAGWP
jgi:hypothetical protein